MGQVAFITGMTGMVGSHLADYLIENTDWDIVGLIRWRSPLDNIKSLVENINTKNRVKLVYGDLNNVNILANDFHSDLPFQIS